MCEYKYDAAYIAVLIIKGEHAGNQSTLTGIVNIVLISECGRLRDG